MNRLLRIKGDVEITDALGNPSGLPTPGDANFTPEAPSGAVGAKIWLVRSEDVACTGDPAVPVPHMTGWTPQDYLFEGNLIVYQYQPPKKSNDD